MTELAPLLPWVFAVGAVVVLVGGFVLERKRRERIMTFALARGWAYAGEDSSLVDRWPGEPFGRGERRRARNVLTGQESGRAFTAFDYSYVTHSTDSKGHRRSSTQRYGVCVVAAPAPLGRVEVVPENVITRTADAIGLTPDIDLESDDFNRSFRIRARDAKLASDLLPPRTMEYLLAARPDAWRTAGPYLLSWHPGRLDPASVVRACAVLDRVIDGTPSFVWKDAGVRPAGGYDPQP
ncbi:MAG: hypothetical protein ACRDWY_08310 [Actinomycetes bacterium]